MRVANTTPKYSSRLAAQDNLHLKMGYVKLHEALNELERVYAKDNGGSWARWRTPCLSM